jgi:hypothetical protein
MAQVTLRDLASNEDIVVPPEGYIFGRVGGDADIQIEDNSISRRQARVSFKNGRWLMETLAVPQGTRAPKPVQLEEGLTFTIGESEFEVVALDDSDGEVDPLARTFAPTKSKPGPSSEKTQAGAPAAKRPPTQQLPKDEPAASPGVGALFVALPRGFAYYVVNVPRLLFTPLGTVRGAIEMLPAEPLGRIELIGYALPALLATALIGSISGGIATLIRGGGFDFFDFVPVGPAVVSVIGAVITGFIFHPVLEWIVQKLHGTSDERSRTNYFLQMMTVAVLMAVPNALGTILTALPVPFLNLLGPLLVVAASVVTVFVVFEWFSFFGVVKWFRMALLALGALAVLGGVVSLVQGVIRTVSGGTPSTVTDVAVPPEAAEPSAEHQAVLADLKERGAAIDKAQQRIDEAERAVQKQGEPTEVAPKPERVEKTPPPEVKDEPVAAAPPTLVKEEPAAAREPQAQGSSAYAAFARKRDAVEKLFESDPTVLAKSSELQKLYAKYLDIAWDIERRYAKDSAKHPELRKLNNHLRDAELFRKGGATMDQLAAKLGIR